MADPINATAILAAAQQQATIDAAPTDESLNAGAFASDESTPDVLTTELEADASVLHEMLPKLDEVPTVAQESNYIALSYLRNDLVAKRGMTQQIATEALAMVPSFGKGRPVNFYSKHPSGTGYSMALEELEDAMAADVAGQLAEQALRIHEITVPEEFLTQKIDFKRRADQVCMQGAILRDFHKVSTANGFNWDDTCFQGCAEDKTQNASVPLILTLDKATAYNFGEMDAYYMVHLQGPSLLEFMTSHVQAWNAAFQAQLTAAKDGDTKVKPEIPLAPLVTFNGGKRVSILAAHDVFRDAYESSRTEFDRQESFTLVDKVGNAAQQSKAEDIIVRLKDYYQEASLVADTLQEAAAWLNANGNTSDGLQKLAAEFTDVVNSLNRNVNELHKWLMHAGLALTYTGTLLLKVAEFAWKSVHDCKDTLQMSEGDYNNLRQLVEEIARPIEANLV